MRIKFSKLCLLTGIGMMCFSSQSFASNCTSAPDCVSLGYTKTSSDCEGLDTIKCPFDTSKVFCSGEVEQKVETVPILYGDGTVSDTIVSGKKPIGVVFDEENRLAVALTEVTQDGSAGCSNKVISDMHWSSNVCDTPNLENCSYVFDEVLNCGLDGRENTDAILASTCNGTTYAANAVNAYQTSNCSASFCQKGKWFLPNMRDLNKMYSIKSKIQNVLTLLSSYGACNLSDDSNLFGYWSSNEYFGTFAWSMNLKTGQGGTENKRINLNYVRPVIKF